MQNTTRPNTMTSARTQALIGNCNCADLDFMREKNKVFLDRLPGIQSFVWTQVNKNGWLEKSNLEQKETFVRDLNLVIRIME
jgi:hypothetical protein